MKIAFTSCSRYKAFKVQKDWEHIEAKNPDYLFLLGDNIYMDYGIFPFSKEPVTRPRKYSDEKFERIMREKYVNQFENVETFKRLVEKMRAKNGFYATWDDHDFGWNNAKGSELGEQRKEISRKLFHEFTKCSTNMPHVYYSIKTPMAKVIFLDIRYESEKEGPDAQLISDEQFNFVEKELEHDRKYTLICSGITLTKGGENWSKYPKSYIRLCNMISEKERLIFLSGDIHKNAIVPSFYDPKHNVKVPLQLISSGMNINFFGLGWPFDDQHNWALLELEEGSESIGFYQRNKKMVKLSGRGSVELAKLLNQKA